MATNYNEYWDEMYPQNSEDAIKKVFYNQDRAIDNAYLQGIQASREARDATIAQAYRDYLKATNPYGVTAERMSNAGLSRQGGYGAVVQGYAGMARSNANVAANTAYGQNISSLETGKAAAKNELLGRYADYLKDEEIAAENKKRVAIGNAEKYLSAAFGNIEDFDAFNKADDKDDIISNWRNTIISLYGLDEETADTMLNAYITNKGFLIPSQTGEIDLNGGDEPTGTPQPQIENPNPPPSAILPVDYKIKGTAGKQGAKYTIDGTQYNINWLLSQGDKAKMNTAVAHIKNPIGGHIYQGSDGKFYYFFGDTGNIYSGKWRPLEKD
jgi:hypothetical protein